MAGVEVDGAYVGVPGPIPQCQFARDGFGGQEEPGDQPARHRTSARSGSGGALPSDREILHAIPQEFIVDEQGGIAIRWDAREPPRSCRPSGHQQHDASQDTRDLYQPRRDRGDEMVFEPLATAEAALTHDERELGALLLDIGCGTTE